MGGQPVPVTSANLREIIDSYEPDVTQAFTELKKMRDPDNIAAADMNAIERAFKDSSTAKLIREAILDKKSYVNIPLPGRTGDSKPISNRTLKEVNRALKSSTSFSRIGRGTSNSDAVRVYDRLLVGSNGLAGLITGYILSVVAFSGQPLVTGLTSLVSMYGVAHLTRSHIDYRFGKRDRILLHIKKPEKEGLLAIPGRAITALSVAAVNVKENILARFRPSLEKQVAFRSVFSRNFSDAAQSLIEHGQALNHDKKFDLDIDKFASLSTQKIKLVEMRKTGMPTLDERRSVSIIDDLAVAFKEEKQFVTTDDAHKNKLAAQFTAIVDKLESGIAREEQEKRLMHTLLSLAKLG